MKRAVLVGGPEDGKIIKVKNFLLYIMVPYQAPIAFTVGDPLESTLFDRGPSIVALRYELKWLTPDKRYGTYEYDPSCYTPDPTPSQPKPKKCECGSESIGASTHSAWCPKA